MAARAITGYGGSLTVGGTTIPVTNVTISRQSQEFDVTAHGDTKIFAAPGRVKRGGSFEAYVSAATSGFQSIMETVNLTTPPVLVFTDSAGTTTTLNIVITSADQKHGSDGAAMYSVSFTEALALS